MAGSASAVRRVVRRGTLGLRAVRGAETALLGVAALASTLAAAVASGAALADAETWVAATLGALAAALTWWGEHRTRAADVARMIDARLRQDGALLTAWEVETRADASPLGRRLAERVGRALDPARALRSVLPSSVLPIAAPFLAVALLAVVLDEAAGPRSTDASLRLAEGLATRVAAARERAVDGVERGELGVEPASELVALATRADALGQALERARRGANADGSGAEARRTMDELERGLASLAERVPPDAELARDLADARTWADALRAELGDRLGAAPGAAGDGGGDADRDAGGDAGAAPGANPDRALASGPDQGKMSGPPDGAVDADAPPGPLPDGIDPDPAAGRPEAGAPAAAWWAPEHDPVVERWIETRRAALAGESGD